MEYEECPYCGKKISREEMKEHLEMHYEEMKEEEMKMLEEMKQQQKAVMEDIKTANPELYIDFLNDLAKEGNREIKMLCAVEYLSMDLVERAEEIFKEMLSEPDADVYNGLGICARRKGLYNDAIQYFMKAIEYGEIEVSSTNICDIYEELGEFEKEEEFLKEMIQKYENGYLNAIYARALLIIGRHKEAEDFARKAIQLGEEMEGYLQLAFALIMQGKNDEAEKTLIEMKNKYPDKLQPYILLANIYMDKGEEKAKEYLDEIYKKSRDPYVMEYLAISYMSLGEEEKAEKVLKEAIMLHNLPNFHLIYGALLLDKGEDAKKEFLKALELSPTLNTYVKIADIYLGANDYENARKFVEIAESKFGKDEILYCIKGDISFQEKNYEDAIEEYKKSLMLGENIDAYIGLIRSYKELNEKEKALGICKKAIEIFEDEELYELLKELGG